MALKAGDKLGPYEILAPIGAGGMGEVYQARDSRLGRDVAIKISAEQFSERFEHEARSIAALNHPNICHVYDVGANYLVMELIDGAPLKGPLPLAKALDYARQILDGLDAAHCKGITHRDLKPANILVTKQGIKLLDFGLAKQSGPLKETDVTQALTQHGAIVGTLNYMSPEQLQSKEADARSDIFAFGLVLYEMLTGKPAFQGSSAASVIAAILERPTPSIAEVAPPALDRILARCLAKDPEQRWRSAYDLRAALDLATIPQPAASAAKTRPFGWIAAALFAALAVVAWWAPWREPSFEERPLAFHIVPPPGTRFVLNNGGGAISPDGRTIAMIASSGDAPKLWTRPLGSVVARELAGTDDAQFPFWSPDSESIAFFARGKLKRIDLRGGLISTVADAPTPRGGVWSEDGTILFAPTTNSGLLRVGATGGAASQITSLDGVQETSHRWPQILPGGRQVLFFVMMRDNRRGVFVAPFDDTKKRKLIVESGTNAIYVPPMKRYPGYLVWLRQGSLTAQAVDLNRGQVVGEPQLVPGAEMVGVVLAGNLFSGSSVSNDGTLLASHGSDRNRITWLTRDGKVLGVVSGWELHTGVNISPDGARALLSVGDLSGLRDFWILDFARGVRTRLPTPASNYSGFWSRDGRRVIHYVANGGSILDTDAAGVGGTRTLLTASFAQADDISPDGRTLLFDQPEGDGFRTLSLLPLSASGAADGKPTTLTKTRSRSSLVAQFSPDGRWIAYSSDESGLQEIYVQGYPNLEDRKQVSNSGGSFPRWRRDGKELFYRAVDGRLAVAGVRQAGGSIKFSAPTFLFRIPESFGGRLYPYDISADGQRILALMPDSAESAPLTVLINWQAGLKK
jgi:serine/threonine protein kinase/Tol biopolymer transport system component